MSTTYIPDRDVPVKRLQIDPASGSLAESPKKVPFLRGPIPLAWLAEAAKLPGKTINVAIAIWWHHGMAGGKPFKLTKMVLNSLNVGRDAATAGLNNLEQAGLIKVERKQGQRHSISVLNALGIEKRDVSRLRNSQTG